MAYVNPRGLPIADMGPDLRTVCAYTLTDYSAAGTVDAAVGDIVMFSTTGDWYVKLAADDTTKRMGQVEKVEQAAGSGVGYLVIRWLDIVRFVVVATDDLSTVTLGNSLIKDGNTTVVNNFDAGSTTGSIIAVAKSGTSGAGTVVGAVAVL